MQFEKITLDEIKPSEYNPRIISEEELAKLEKNIKEFGLVDPIIINLKNNHIIGGHQRYEVLRKLAGTDTNYENTELKLIRLGNVGWVLNETELDIFDETHEKALNLALNKISGDWDYSKLDLVLEDMKNEHFDIDLTGFDDLDLAIFDDSKINFEKNTTSNNNQKINDEVEENEIEYYDDNEEFDKHIIEDEIKVDNSENYLVDYDSTKTTQKTFNLKENQNWKIGNHILNINEIDPNYQISIKIIGEYLHIRFTSLESEEDPINKFITENQKVIE